MKPDDTIREEIPFAEDFAARVFAAAGRVRAQRRLAVAAAVLLVSAAGAMALWRPPVPDRSAPAAVEALNDDYDLSAYTSQTPRTEPLDFMFPDAAPLERFSERYATAYGGGLTEGESIYVSDLDDDGSR